MTEKDTDNKIETNTQNTTEAQVKQVYSSVNEG